MRPIEDIKTCFRKYAVFSGRAQRSEYWWFFGFSIFGMYASLIADTAILGLYALGQPMKWVSLGGAFSLVTILPILSVGYRRLQDTGLPGWIYLVLTAIAYSQIFAPGTATYTISNVATIATVILCVRRSERSSNAFGPNPHEVSQ